MGHPVKCILMSLLTWNHIELYPGADPGIFNGGAGHRHFLRRKTAMPGCPHTIRHPISAKTKGGGEYPYFWKKKNLPLMSKLGQKERMTEVEDSETIWALQLYNYVLIDTQGNTPKTKLRYYLYITSLPNLLIWSQSVFKILYLKGELYP